MITQEIKAQFTDNDTVYRVYFVKRFFRKTSVYAGKYKNEKEVLGTDIKVSVTASNFKQKIAHCLWELKRKYDLRKDGKENRNERFNGSRI